MRLKKSVKSKKDKKGGESLFAVDPLCCGLGDSPGVAGTLRNTGGHFSFPGVAGEKVLRPLNGGKPFFSDPRFISGYNF